MDRRFGVDPDECRQDFCEGHGGDLQTVPLLLGGARRPNVPPARIRPTLHNRPSLPELHARRWAPLF